MHKLSLYPNGIDPNMNIKRILGNDLLTVLKNFLWIIIIVKMICNKLLRLSLYIK